MENEELNNVQEEQVQVEQAQQEETPVGQEAEEAVRAE